jgi:hypothetical protein
MSKNMILKGRRIESDCELRTLQRDLVTVSNPARLAESDPESENTTLNLQVSFGVTPADEHNPTTYPNNPETISIPSASVIPSGGWPVPEPQFSSAQYIGLPMADYSAALGNGFLDSPYDDSQSQGGWTMSEPGFSSAQYVGLPYSTALGNGFLDTPYDGLQSLGAWKTLGPGFSSAQYVGLPPAEHSTALGNESMHHDGLQLG